MTSELTFASARHRNSDVHHDGVCEACCSALGLVSVLSLRLAGSARVDDWLAANGALDLGGCDWYYAPRPGRLHSDSETARGPRRGAQNAKEIKRKTVSVVDGLLVQWGATWGSCLGYRVSQVSLVSESLLGSRGTV